MIVWWLFLEISFFKVWTQILVPRGILQKSQKFLQIFDIISHMKEEEIMMLTAQRLELPDDDFPRYDFPKCEILTSNFGPEGNSSKFQKFWIFEITCQLKGEEDTSSMI